MTPLMISDAETHFTARMLAQYPTMPIMFANQQIPNTTGLYAALYVIAGDTFPINLGITAKSRNVGEIQMHVMGPKDRGAGETGDVALYMGRIFRRQVRVIGLEGQVTYKDPSYMDAGVVRGKQTYIARIPYRYDFQG